MAIRIVFEEDVADRFDVDFGDALERGLWRPRIYCDECGELIDEGTGALLSYRTDPGNDQGLPHFTHHECTKAFLDGRAGDWSSAGLAYFPIQLANALDDRAGKRIFDLAPRLPGAEPDLVGIRPPGKRAVRAAAGDVRP